MLKKITTEQVCLGMYIHGLEGSWLSHPFWKSKFVLDDPADLRALKKSGVLAVWIDCDKGRDVAELTVASDAAVEPTAEPNPEPAVTETVAVAGKQPVAPAIQLNRTTSAQEELGRASGIIHHSKEVVAKLFTEARLGKAIEVEQCLSLVEEISGSVARNSAALISLARLKNKDEYTYMHSVSVCALMIALARQMQLDEEQTQQAGVAGLLHDIGKMAMPEKILNKPGALTTDEFSVIRLHPERGHAILTQGGFTAPSALDVCLHHHEKIDGSGYPYGLKGEQISQLARMGAVCDVYDAITSNRPYKNGWDAADSLARMAKWEGHFDTAIFHAFVKMVGIYPLGSLVRLHSGRLGVIVEQNPQSLTRPLLKVFFSTRTNMPIPVQLLDLSKSGQTDTIVNREDPQKWQFSNLNALWQG